MAVIYDTLTGKKMARTALALTASNLASQQASKPDPGSRHRRPRVGLEPDPQARAGASGPGHPAEGTSAAHAALFPR